MPCKRPDYRIHPTARPVWVALLMPILVASATPAFATVAAMSLETLVADSGHIVVAKVYAVEDSGKGRRRARADVLDVWKGPNRREVIFNATPTWTCDISGATEGEQVVLFLGVGEPGELVYIWHSGRGRMPVREVKGKLYADLWDDVVLPEGTATIDGPRPELTFIRSIELSSLGELVRQIIAEHGKREDPQ